MDFALSVGIHKLGECLDIEGVNNLRLVINVDICKADTFDSLFCPGDVWFRLFASRAPRFGHCYDL